MYLGMYISACISQHVSRHVSRHVYLSMYLGMYLGHISQASLCMDANCDAVGEAARLRVHLDRLHAELHVIIAEISPRYGRDAHDIASTVTRALYHYLPDMATTFLIWQLFARHRHLPNMAGARAHRCSISMRPRSTRRSFGSSS